MRTQQLFEARREFVLAGDTVLPGQVIDLDDYSLPPGRIEALVAARYGRLVTVPDDPSTITDPDDEYASLSNARLRERLGALGLPVYGAKADLVARLRAAAMTAGDAPSPA